MVEASETRVEKGKWLDGMMNVRGKQIPFKYRRPTAPEKRKAMMEATRQIRQQNMPSEMTEMLTQSILLPELVAEVGGEATSRAYWDEVEADVDTALRTELFGYPGELFLQPELLKNLATLPNIRMEANPPQTP